MIEQADSSSSRSLSTVLVTGASGLVGRSVVRRLHEEHPLAKIYILGRNASGVRELDGIPVLGFHWDPDVGQLDPKALLGVDGLVHLAGETVAQRWTSSVKTRIRSSRIDSLSLIEAACREHALAPRVVSASAIGWYPSKDAAQDESMPAATDFLAEVVQDWEAAAAALGSLGGGMSPYELDWCSRPTAVSWARCCPCTASDSALLSPRVLSGKAGFTWTT